MAKQFKFTVKVKRTRVDYQSHEVTAETQLAARVKALKLSKRDDDAWCDGPLPRHRAEIVHIKEI